MKALPAAVLALLIGVVWAYVIVPYIVETAARPMPASSTVGGP